MDPKLWSAAKRREDTNTAKAVGRINFSLLRKTPLNISSSEIGDTMMIANKPLVKNELNRFCDVATPKIKFEKYNMPYDKNMFKITTKRTIPIKSREKRFEMSSPT